MFEANVTTNVSPTIKRTLATWLVLRFLCVCCVLMEDNNNKATKCP